MSKAYVDIVVNTTMLFQIEISVRKFLDCTVINEIMQNVHVIHYFYASSFWVWNFFHIESFKKKEFYLNLSFATN